ncbi:MAG: insulinase family protein [Prevotella sp.]|nr:insulinase family protein [Alistipes senegalensis]MCM1357479.1 insulinase family protein [Prevotella sp.]MCM1473669.1 insulinase family protein [Muribaculaceae bacterium]
MKYNRTELKNNVGFTSIIDGKFKTAHISVRFITRLSEETAAANVIGTDVLTYSTSSLPTLSLLNEKLSSLYGANLSSYSSKKGDSQILEINVSYIVNRYAIDGEDIEGEMASLLIESIFSPNAKDGKFDEESFMITKKELLDRIDSEINNKRGYALARAAETAFREEPAGCMSYGTRKTAETVTAESAYSAYLNLLKTALVEITYVAPSENPAVLEMFRKSFSETERIPEKINFNTPSPIKSEVVTESEEFDVRQCKMVMAFKHDYDNMYAVKMLNNIWGETPVSKLFLNVREKLSLCYYCATRINKYKKAVFVDIGVERNNIEKAKAEILHQLDEIRNGNITDEEISSALLSLDNALNSVGDTPSLYSGWYFNCLCDNEIITPEECFRKYKAVTKEDIINAAKSLTLDSIYIMYDKEEQK